LNEVSIFGLPTKRTETMLKLHRAVLCFVHRDRGERGRRNGNAIRACDTNVQHCGRSKFEKLCVDFWAPYKIPSFRHENGFVRCFALYTG